MPDASNDGIGHAESGQEPADAVAHPVITHRALRLRQWIKGRETPAADLSYCVCTVIRRIELPVIPVVHRTLYHLRSAVLSFIATILRIFWWTPLFRSRLARSGTNLFLMGNGVPLVLGPLTMRIGRGCQIDTQTTFAGRSAGPEAPELVAGDNVTISWQTTIAVGRRIVLGDNVVISAQCFLAGYPGHPLDARDRAAGLPDTPDQAADIVLEKDVWLATRVVVSAGVRIGEGTVVAAGSVVTHDLPAGVLAAGAPARVVRMINATTKRLAT